jgi:hypothetical protein
MNKKLKKWIENSLFEIFNSSDNDLINRKLKEECINHRFAYYLEKNKPIEYHDYYVDVEYNKNGFNEKTLKIDDLINVIRPDILIHKRIDDISDNLLAIECKISYLIKNDKQKLNGLLGNGFRYKEAIGISYQSNKDYFLIYEKNTEFKKSRRICKNICKI